MSISRGKTICFIDNANIFHGQQGAGWRIDWEKFLRYIERDEQVWQTYFFASETDPPREEAIAFYQFLKEQLRWEVMLYQLGKKTLRCQNCDHSEIVFTEKGVDVGLAIKMLTLGINQAFETALLVSGDRDYLETIKYLKNIGLRVEVISWQAGLSDAVATESSTPVIFLDDIKDLIMKD